MAHAWTKDRSKLVMNLMAFGCELNYVAKQLDCTVNELKQIYAEELEYGGQDALKAVANRLFNIATTGDAKVAVPAIVFWLKCKAGWREPPKEIELAGKGGKDLNFAGRDELLNKLAEELSGELKKTVQ